MHYVCHTLSIMLHVAVQDTCHHLGVFVVIIKTFSNGRFTKRNEFKVMHMDTF